jgi:hypothetical protein
MENGLGLEFQTNMAFRLALLLCLLFFLAEPAPSQKTPVTRLAVSREVAAGGHWCGLLEEKVSAPLSFPHLGSAIDSR